jgi:hypothetical protein
LDGKTFSRQDAKAQSDARIVMPAHAGIQALAENLDSRFHGNDA